MDGTGVGTKITLLGTKITLPGTKITLLGASNDSLSLLISVAAGTLSRGKEE